MTNHENDISTTIENNTENELAQVNKNISEADNVNSLTPTPYETNELNPLAEPAATGQKNIISVDEASSVSSGNNIYINQDNKLMQIDYDTLATAILNKLSTQSFNSLNTSSKLVLDAINELNGKTLYQTMTVTNDVLQSAESQALYQAKFYLLVGDSYTGDIPSGGNYKYGTAIVFKRGPSTIFVVIFSPDKPIYNSYGIDSWIGWKDCTGTLVS